MNLSSVNNTTVHTAFTTPLEKHRHSGHTEAFSQYCCASANRVSANSMYILRFSLLHSLILAFYASGLRVFFFLCSTQPSAGIFLCRGRKQQTLSHLLFFFLFAYPFSMRSMMFFIFSMLFSLYLTSTSVFSFFTSISHLSNPQCAMKFLVSYFLSW